MKVHLIIPNLEGDKPNWANVGLLYVAAATRDSGHVVKVIDANVENMPDEKLQSMFADEKPDVIGITMTTRQAPSAFRAAQLAKSAAHAVVVVGGAHPTALPDQTLNECEAIDIVVRGEGEHTVVELLESLQTGKKLDAVLGITYRNNSKIVNNPPRPRIEHLDSIPYPAYDLVPVRKYFRNQIGPYFPSANIFASRGCPFRCVFCSDPVWRGKVIFRSVSNIVDEIELLHEKFKIKEIYFLDDNFNLRSSWVEEFCAQMITRELNKKIKWRAQARVNTPLVSMDLFSKMKEAGCWMLSFGVESGNQNVLDLNKKHITLDEVRRAFQLAKNVGLRRGAFFMVGNFGDTKASIRDTTRFAQEVNPDWIQFNITSPCPGSELYEIVKQREAIRKAEWNNYDQRTPLLAGEDLSPEYLSKAVRRAYIQFYFRPSYILGHLRSLSLQELKAGFIKLKRQVLS